MILMCGHTTGVSGADSHVVRALYALVRVSVSEDGNSCESISQSGFSGDPRSGE